jgi:hypothetical protein
MSENNLIQYSGAFWGILLSHGLFVLSGVAYSTYWVLEEIAPGQTAEWMFFLALVLGCGGAASAFVSIKVVSEDAPKSGLKLPHIVGACAALLVVMCLLTTGAMARPLTSELVFAMIWAAVELCALHVAHCVGWIAGRKALAALVGVILALLIGLLCYTIYFFLDGRARFYAGLVPYGAVSLAMLVAGILLLLGKKKSAGLAE